MTSVDGQVPRWEEELAAMAAAPAAAVPDPAGLGAVLVAVRQACAVLPREYYWADGTTSPADFAWERGMIRAAAEEAMSFPAPAALVAAVLDATRPGKHSMPGEYWDRTASGCQHAARAEVRGLAASLKQLQGPPTRYGRLIEEATRPK